MANYINKDALLEKLQERYDELIEQSGAEDDYTRGYGAAIDAIDIITLREKADMQEVKHAKWIPDRFGMERAICSICRATYEGGDSFRFCPKCGAKMDLEDNK